MCLNTYLDKAKERINSDPNFYAMLFLLMYGFVLYAYTFGYDWSYDDIFVIYDNTDVRSLRDFFQNNYPGRPLRELSAMLDYNLFGYIKAGWHIQNILWHSLNAWLVFIVSRLLLDDKNVAWMASLLFLVHPLQVEVVAQVSHRKDSLALFCMLVSFIFYFKGRTNKHCIYLALSAAFFLLSLFAKQNAYAFPLFLLIFELLRKNSNFEWLKLNRRISLYLLFGFVSIGFMVFFPKSWSSYIAKANLILVGNNFFEGFSLQSYFLLIMNAWLFMFSKLIFPFDLYANYVLETPGSFFSFNILLTLSLLLLVFWALVLSVKKSTYLFFAILWVLILFLPVSNLIPITHVAADRYMYAPSVGFCMAAAFLIRRLIVLSKWSSFLFAAIFFGLSVMTILQSFVWQNNETIWTHALAINPNSARAVSNVGQVVYSDDLERKLDFQLRAADINPYDPFVQKILGGIYEEMGQPDISMEYYKKAYDLFPQAGCAMYTNFCEELREKLNNVPLD